MKKRWYLIVLAALMLVACDSNKSEKNKEGNENMKEIEKSTKNGNEWENFYQLLKEDKEGDKKSIYWDGNTASIIDDEFDSFDISDGRGEITGTKTVTVPGVFELYYPDNLEDIVTVSDKENSYHLTGKNLDIQVQEIDFKSEQKKLEEKTDYKKIKSDILSEHQRKYFKDFELYVGIADTDNGAYAGYTLLFESSLNDKAYSLSVLGIGNLEEIKMNALYIMNHFEVIF